MKKDQLSPAAPQSSLNGQKWKMHVFDRLKSDDQLSDEVRRMFYDYQTQRASLQKHLWELGELFRVYKKTFESTGRYLLVLIPSGQTMALSVWAEKWNHLDEADKARMNKFKGPPPPTDRNAVTIKEFWPGCDIKSNLAFIFGWGTTGEHQRSADQLLVLT